MKDLIEFPQPITGEPTATPEEIDRELTDGALLGVRVLKQLAAGATKDSDKESAATKLLAIKGYVPKQTEQKSGVTIIANQAALVDGLKSLKEVFKKSAGTERPPRPVSPPAQPADSLDDFEKTATEIESFEEDT